MSALFARCRRAGVGVWGLGLVAVLVLAPRAQAQAGYAPCLGCAEHAEIRVRWHRPFWAELAGEGFAMFDHFRLEQDAANLGLCESDPLIRSPLAINGCHRFSATRAWLIEAPLELVAFTSPAWGLARHGHPRWAMVLELAPIAYHAFSAIATVDAIHQWQRQLYLYGNHP